MTKADPQFEETDATRSANDLSWMYVKSFAQYRIYVDLFLLSFRYHVFGMKVIKKRPLPALAEISGAVAVLCIPGFFESYYGIGFAFIFGIYCGTVSFFLLFKR